MGVGLLQDGRRAALHTRVGRGTTHGWRCSTTASAAKLPVRPPGCSLGPWPLYSPATPCPRLPRPTRQQVPGRDQVHHVLRPRGVHGHELAVRLQLHVVDGARGDLRGRDAGGGSGVRARAGLGVWQGDTLLLRLCSPTAIHTSRDQAVLRGT